MKNILVMRKLINDSVLRVALLLMFFPLSIAGWASATYKYRLKTVTQNNTGLGRVYASETNADPEFSNYYASNDNAYSAVTNSSGTYYLWAIPTKRGVVFDNWTTTSTSSGGCTAGSSTLTNTTTMQGASVKITAPTEASGTSTYTTTATVTANWKDPYSKAVVTYATPTDGKYRVTYEYSYLNTTTNKLETGFSFDMDESSAARVEDSYNNDVITLQSLDGVFEGWYNGSTLLSTANSYTYVASADGSSATISAHYTHVDKYYGKLTASIAAVPYSMPGGGTIFIANDPDATGTYSDAAQQVSLTTYGVSQSYYLHAKPNDKRYVFRGWYSNPECTGTALSTSADYTYTFTSSSTNSASPTLGNVYAAFDFNLYYMQVEVEPAVPGLGMVLVKDNNTGMPEYTDYTTHAEQFLYAYRLAPTANAYLYAKPKYGYKFSGWYDNPDCTGTAKSTANPYTYAATGTSTDPMNPTIIPLYAKFVEDATTVNITYNLPDQTKGEYTASVLDIAEVDDDFIWTFTQVYTSEGKTGNTTQAQHKTDVLRLEAQPQAGYGVTSWTIAGAAKTTPSQLYETTGTAAATYGVTFGDAKPFLVCSTTSATTGTAYATLREAIDNLGSNKKIVVVQNAYVPAGNYTIPSGVTLLVPFDEGQTLCTTKPGITKAAPSGQSAYCTLTLASGANIAVNGAISVSAHQNKGQPYGGAVTGKYGKIELKDGAKITLNSGSYLYCWGYITGAGQLDALNGSNVYEDFQIACWRGGTAASSMNGNSNKVFPLAQYYIQNIESKINFHYGSSETVYTGVTISYVDPEGSAKIIGASNCLFQLKTGAILTRWFDASKDRQMYLLNGDATLGYVEVSISVTVDSRDYILPLTNNMDITINSGSTFTCDYDFAVLPGASITINEGAKVSLGSNCRAYLYDKSEWPEKTTGFNYPGNVAFYKIAYTDTKITTARTYANMADAKFDVNGTLEVNKAIYTTAGGADICSSKGTGNIQFKAAAGTETVTYQATQSGSSISYTSIPITSAKLHNGDDSYTLTAGSVSGDKFIYSKPQEKWLKNPKVVSWNANGGTTEASTMAYSEGAFIGELPAAYKDGYTLEGWYTAASGGTAIGPTTKVTANATYHAHWTPKTFTITYRDQGGAAFSGSHVDSPNAHPTSHTFGTATTLNSATKDGFIFGGWYRTPSCSGTAVTTLSESECKDITLYAQWRAVSVTANGKTNYYTSLSKALAVANTKTESTITILVDITDTTTPLSYAPASANSTCTLDLNGKTVSLTITGSGTSEIKMLDVNAANSTFTITDNSTNKDGVFKLIASPTTTTQTKRWHGVYLTDGTLMLKAGKVYAEDNFKYTSTSDAGMVSGVTIAAGKTFTMTGGSIDAYCKYAAYGLQVNGSASANANINISGGTIHAETTEKTTAYGIYTLGRTTTISGGTIEAKSKTTTAAGIYVQSSKNGYAGKVEMTGGTVNSTSTTTTAYGVLAQVNATGKVPAEFTMSGGTVNVTTGTHTAYGIYVNRAAADAENIYKAIANVSGGEINVTSTTTSSTSGKEVTDGIYSLGTTTITGNPEITVTATKTYARGIRVLDGKTTISGTPTFTVRATQYAYGAVVAGVAPTEAGVCSNAELEINNGTFDVATTTSTYAYGAIVKPENPTADYESPSKLTINDGYFKVEAKKTTAQGVNCSRGYLMAGTRPNVLSKETLGTAIINGGTFDVSTLGTTTAQGITNSGNTTVSNAIFNVTPKTTTAYGARCYHGLLTINEGAEFNVTATEKAYGVVAGNEQPTTAGVLYDAEVVINGGTINVETTSKATIYGLWASRNSRTIATGTANEGNYASAGKITVNGGEINVTAKTNPAYAVVVDAVVTQSGNADYPAATATPQAFINGGKFFVTATSSKNYAVSDTPLAENCQITGGYYNVNRTQTSGTTLAKYAVAPNKVLTLRSSHALYPDGYRYTVGEGGTVTWKNGTTTLLSEVYLKEEIPAYTGETPTKAEDAQYTYTHDSWTPTITAMNNSDVTYSATFTSTKRKYTILFLDGDGSTLTNTPVDNMWEYGTKPTFTGATPKKAEDATNTYTFNGTWSDGTNTYATAELPNVTGDKTYTAQFTANPKELGAYLDIVDWSGNGDGQSLTLNMNGYTSNLEGHKTDWKIKIGSTEKSKNNRATDRTLVFDGLTLDAGSHVSIEGYDADNTLETKYDYLIPQVVTSSTTITSASSSYLYVRSGSLTIKGDITVDKVVVCAGAELIINSGKTLTINDKLVLRTKAFSSAVLTNNGTLAIAGGGQMYYSRIVSDKSQTYQIGFPLNANLGNVKFSHGGDAAQNSSFGLFTYNSAQRASSGNGNGNNWDLFTGTAMTGKQGYQLLSTSSYYQEFMFPVTYTKPNEEEVVNIAAYPSENKQDRGWNYVVSPYTYVYACTFTSPEDAIKVCELASDNTTFYQHVPTNIYPAMPFYYQAESAGTLKFASTGLSFISNASGAPARKSNKNSAVSTQWIQLLYGKHKGSIYNVEDAADPAKASILTDETNIFINKDKYTIDYEIGYDVVKMSKSGPRPFVYTSLTCGDLAFAALPDEAAEAGIAITVYAPEAGMMEFSVLSNDFMSQIEQLILYDAAEDRYIDLRYRDYSYYAEQGTTAGRFYLSAVVRRTPQVTTSEEDASETDLIAWATDRQIFVEYLAGADIYCFDAVGQLVSVDLSKTGRACLNVPTAGVYIVKADNKVSRVLVR